MKLAKRLFLLFSCEKERQKGKRLWKFPKEVKGKARRKMKPIKLEKTSAQCFS